MHVVTGLDIGGAEQMLANLVLDRERRGIRDRVVSMLPGGAIADRLRDAGVEVSDLGMRRGRPSVGALRALARRFRESAPRVVQSWMYHADLISLAALKLARLREHPRLYWGVRCSDLDLRRYGIGLRLVVKACALGSRLPEAVVANSSRGAEVHRRLGYRPRAFPVIENGVDTALFRPDPALRSRVRGELALAESTPVVAHVARVDPMKDHGSFLAAMTRSPGVVGIAVGRGTEALPAHESVRRLGERRDVAAILAASDVIVSSSAFGEGFSNVLAEGMACGCVPIATDVGDARRIVGDLGVIVPPRRPDLLAQAIGSVLADDAAARAAKADAVRRRIEWEFSLARSVQAFDELHGLA